MSDDEFRISDRVRVRTRDDGFVLEAREEVGRGKRFGMDGEIAIGPGEAERFAKWVFARELGQ